MDERLTKLADYGCEISGALKRVIDDEDLLVACINDVLHDKSFGRLHAALCRADREESFNLAHMLKGVTGNVGLTPLFSALSALVNPLRAECDVPSLLPLFNEAEEIRVKFLKIMEE